MMCEWLGKYLLFFFESQLCIFHYDCRLVMVVESGKFVGETYE